MANFVWKKYAYAVQVYGICVDTLKDGTTGGLTFGPAIGADYTCSYKYHTPTGTTKSGNPHRCIHADNWWTIVQWNMDDPYVYEQCVENECTQSVPLTFTSENSGYDDSTKVFNTRTAISVTGDGAGLIYNEMHTEARVYASTNDETLTWANSKIRAALNGAQDVTNTTYGGTKYTEDNSVLSAFPTVLRNNIGAKAVQYAVKYNDYKNVGTVYDKLWLFSNVEIYGDSIGTSQYSYNVNYQNYANEGTQYPRTKNISMTASESYTGAKGWTSSGSALWWWLRSRYGNSGNVSSCVYGGGGLFDYLVVHGYGVAPGFVLARQGQ